MLCMHIIISIIQVLRANVTWNECGALPARLYGGTSIAINGKVYCSGGEAITEDDYYYVYCYDLSLDQWMTLPPPPLKWFSLGHINGKLVAIGGQENCTSKGTKKSEKSLKGCAFDEKEQKWKRTIPPLPTARNSPRVLSLQSALVVAGGYTQSKSCAGTVEIFKSETGQWYTTDPLPAECTAISIVAIDNICYILGALECTSYLNQTYYASLDDLLLNAIPVSQTRHSHSDETKHQSVWNLLPNTPTYRPAAAMLAGNLLAIGGNETDNYKSAERKEIHIYSPSTNSWIYVSDLPAPRSRAIVASLSATEILVMGGRSGGSKVNTVYKGTLHLKV